MPPSEQSRVFISYAHRDGAGLAKRLQRSLTEQGFDTWLDTQRLTGGVVWSAEIEREIDARQVTLALLSPGSYSSEICRAEQLRSLDKGKRVIPVLAVKGADRPLYVYARQYRDFSSDTDYAASLGELLADIRGDATATLPDNYRKTRVTYLTAPPRVANYLERPEALHALRDALFAEDHRQPIALTALAGMGGIGKTVLARALTEDEVVRRAFPDGIVWITAGKQSKRDFITEMREVAKALGDDLSGYDTALACEHQYRTTIANKAALIVVDDVWSTADIEQLLAESPRSRFLFTTRDASIGRFVSAHEHRADLLDIAQSRELLASWAKLPVAELPAAADEVIAECGRLPLALSVVGAMLRGENKEFCTDTLDLLRKADLSAIQDQLPEGQQSFFKAVEVSFQSLKPEMQERYKALAVLLEDMAAPLPILQTLWNVSEAEARRISRSLVDRSLAQRDAEESIRLHDLQLDYVRAQYPDKEALELIHDALRLSTHILSREPAEFAAQLTGRLLIYGDRPPIRDFLVQLAQNAPKPWLRPYRPTLTPPGGPLLRTIEGHGGEVRSVAVSNNRQFAISAHLDATVKLWELKTGRQLRVLQGHTGAVNSVSVSADWQVAVSASFDGTLAVWDLNTGRNRHKLTGHSGPVFAAAVSADGRFAVSGSRDATVRVWDVERGSMLRTLVGHTGEVYCVGISANGQFAISGSGDQTLKVWDVQSGRELRTLRGHRREINGVAVCANWQLAISASDDGLLGVWDLDTGSQLVTLKGSSGTLCVAISANGRLAVSGSHARALEVWDITKGDKLWSTTGHSGWVWGIALTADGVLAATASQDGTVKVWDLGVQVARPATEDDREAIAVGVSTEAFRAVSAHFGQQYLNLWDLETGCPIGFLPGHDSGVRGVAITADGSYVVSASSDRTLKIWDVDTGMALHTLRGHSDAVCAVALSATKRVVSVSDDNTLRTWDLRTGEPLRTLAGNPGNLESPLPVHHGHVAVSANGRRAVSSFAIASFAELHVWNLETEEEPRKLLGNARFVQDLAVSSDGRLALSPDDASLIVWDLEKLERLQTLKGHTDHIWGVDFSPDAKFCLSVSEDRTLKIWNLGTEDSLTFSCDVPLRCCAWHKSGRIVAGDASGNLHFLILEQ